jgi:hypothetical protein
MKGLAGILARLRGDYLEPLQSKMAARIDSLADDIEAASSGAQAKRLQTVTGQKSD